MNIEDRVRDAYTLVDDRGPTVAPPLRHSAHRPARRRLLRLATPLAVAGTVTAGLLVAGVMNTAPGNRTPNPVRSTSASPAPREMSLIAMMMRPSRDDQVKIYLCNRISASPWCQKRAATPAERAAIIGELKKRPEVLRSAYISEKQAYADAKKAFAGNPGFSDTIQLGDIPDSFQVTVRRPADAQSIVNAFTRRPGVDQVVARKVG